MDLCLHLYINLSFGFCTVGIAYISSRTRAPRPPNFLQREPKLAADQFSRFFLQRGGIAVSGNLRAFKMFVFCIGFYLFNQILRNNKLVKIH
jgi:hypothetical protein